MGSRLGIACTTFFLGGALAACGGPTAPSARDRLEAASLEPVAFVDVEGQGRLEAFRGRVPTTGASLEGRARAFLDAYAAALGLEGRLGSLPLLEVEEGASAGAGRVELGYELSGLPVLGAGVSVHLSAPGDVFFVALDLPARDDVDAREPVLSVADAERRAREHVGDPARAVLDTTLGLHAELRRGGGSTLAYRVRLAAGTGALPSVVVGASDGEILAELDDARHATREIRSARRTEDIAVATAGAFDVLSVDVAPPAGEPLAVELYDHLGTVNDWFVDRFGWDGLDGMGRTRTIAYVHFGPAPAPGDPDPALARDAGMLRGDTYFGDHAVSLSIVAHEHAHALVERLGELDGRHEAGALNESIADVFAALVTGTWAIVGRDGAVQRDLAAPASISAPTDPRDGVTLVSRPNHRSRAAGWLPTAELAATRENDWGYVHHNSSIASSALYLATQGGTHPVTLAALPGIGARRMASILWDVVRWQRLSRTASFARAREALVASCLALVRRGAPALGTELRLEHCGVLAHAFGAVGVGALDPDLDTRVGAADHCPDHFDFDEVDADRDGTPDGCEPVAPADAGAIVSSCPPSMPVSDGTWALDDASGPSTDALGLTTLHCNYRGRANDAWFVLDWRGGDTEYHAACVASEASSSLAMCSTTGRQARVVLYATQDGVEDEAEERFAMGTLVPLAEAMAGACPSPIPAGCAEPPIACPLELPAAVGGGRLLPEACPTRSGDGTFVQQICSYSQGTCGGDAGTALSLVALVVDGAGAAPIDADMCSGTAIVDRASGRDHYAPGIMARVSLQRLEARVDLPALDPWAAAFVASLDARALACP